jgi:hypothetical protein
MIRNEIKNVKVECIKSKRESVTPSNIFIRQKPLIYKSKIFDGEIFLINKRMK